MLLKIFVAERFGSTFDARGSITKTDFAFEINVLVLLDNVVLPTTTTQSTSSFPLNSEA